MECDEEGGPVESEDDGEEEGVKLHLQWMQQSALVRTEQEKMTEKIAREAVRNGNDNFPDDLVYNDHGRLWRMGQCRGESGSPGVNRAREQLLMSVEMYVIISLYRDIDHRELHDFLNMRGTEAEYNSTIERNVTFIPAIIAALQSCKQRGFAGMVAFMRNEFSFHLLSG